jgi:hypothetical protein
MATIQESELYPTVKRYLDERFHQLQKPPSGISLWHSAMTPHLDIGLPGSWTRPDLAAVHVWRHKFGPTINLDLHSFEVKRSDNCNEISVFEALAQTRIAHFSHLVWHRPLPLRQPDRFESIKENCRAFGVGLISFTDHIDPDSFTWHNEVVARRNTPDLELVDRYIERAFPDKADTICSWLPKLS